MLVSAITYMVDGRKNFKGPKDMDAMMARVKEGYAMEEKL